MVRAECDVAPASSTSRKSAAEQKQSQSQSPVKVCKRSKPVSSRPRSQTPVSNLFLSQVAELIRNTLRRMPRLSEPGPLGMRASRTLQPPLCGTRASANRSGRVPGCGVFWWRSTLCDSTSTPSLGSSTTSFGRCALWWMAVATAAREHLNQHGCFLCSTVGSSWAAQPSTPQRTNVRISLRPGLIYSRRKTGQPSQPFCVLNVMLLLFSAQARKSAAEHTQSRVRKVATLARSGERGRALAAARHAHQYQSHSRWSKR